MICFLCSNFFSDLSFQTIPQEKGGSDLYEFLCCLCDLKFLLNSSSEFEKLTNAEFCETCSEVLRSGIDIQKQIEHLHYSLRNIKTSVQDLFYSSQNFIGKESPSREIIKKIFIQCLSLCTVLIPRVPKKYELERRMMTSKRRSRCKEKYISEAERILTEEIHSETTEISAEELRDINLKVEVDGTHNSSISTDETLNKPKEHGNKDRTESTSAAWPTNTEETNNDEDFSIDNNSYFSDLSDESTASEEKSKRGTKKARKGRNHEGPNSKKRRKKSSIVNGTLIYFTCKFCKQEFVAENFKTPSGAYEFRCELEKCGKLCRDFPNFRRHHRDNCPERHKPTFPCEQCDLVLLSKLALEQHRVRSHTKEFSIYCDQCGLGLVSKGALTSHMLHHTAEKRFQCSICGNSYKRNIQLKHHMRRHNNELPYVCSMCGKGFINLQHLKIHEPVHSTERKLKCPHCERMFVSMHQVRNHIYSAHKEFRKRRRAIESSSTNEVKLGAESDTTKAFVPPSSTDLAEATSNSHALELMNSV